MTDLIEFNLFPSLPVELRLKIWSEIPTPYDEPRIHSIRGFARHVLKRTPTTFTHNPDDTGETHLPNSTKRLLTKEIFLSPHEIHPLLHTCHESRRFLTEKFNLIFAFETLVNFSLDILFMDTCHLSIWSGDVNNPGSESISELIRHPNIASKIQTLALHVDNSSPTWIHDQAMLLKDHLTGLKEVVLVQSDTRTNHSAYSTGSERDVMFVDFGMYYGKTVTRSFGHEITDAEERWNLAFAGEKDYVPTAFRHVVAAKRSRIWMYLGGSPDIPIINYLQGWD